MDKLCHQVRVVDKWTDTESLQCNNGVWHSSSASCVKSVKMSEISETESLLHRHWAMTSNSALKYLKIKWYFNIYSVLQAKLLCTFSPVWPGPTVYQSHWDYLALLAALFVVHYCALITGQRRPTHWYSCWALSLHKDFTWYPGTWHGFFINFLEKRLSDMRQS